MLRWGGCPQSDRAARAALPALLPALRRGAAGADWEAEASLPAACSAPLLRFLLWPEADERSAARLAQKCPRITLLVPRPGGAAAAQRAWGAPPVAGTCDAPVCGALRTRSDEPMQRPPLQVVPVCIPDEADLGVALDAPALAGALPLLSVWVRRIV